MDKIQLNLSSISRVPFHVYDTDFSFIVNGKEYKTNHLVSDILSPKISKIHNNDPTLNTFIINTKAVGDFSTILKLINGNQIDIPKSETNFIFEVFQILGYDSIDYVQSENNLSEITAENVFSNVQYHEKYAYFFSQNLGQEIEFISSHFYELSEKEELSTLSVETLEAIFSSESIQLNSEDQLLRAINKLYSKSRSYYPLFEYIKFNFLSTEAIQEFIEIFDSNDLTKVTWNQICNRLKCEVENKIQCDKRYTDKKPKKNNAKAFIKKNDKKSNSKSDFSVKTIIVGDSGVGKTDILTRFTRDFFDENVQPTLGVEFMAKIVQAEKSRIELQLWDTGGQELFRSVTRGYYRGSMVGYLVFDLTQRSTFDNLEKWLSDIKKVVLPNCIFVLIGNKSDQSERRQVSEAEIESFAKKHNIEFFFETSAKTGENINEAICSCLPLIEEMVSSFDN